MLFAVCATDITTTRSENELLIQIPPIVSTEHLLSVIWQLRNECPVHGQAATRITVDISAVENAPSALMVVLESFGLELRRQGHRFIIRG